MNELPPEFDLRAYLLGGPAGPVPGTWVVERDLLDRAAGTRGTFAGVVRFSPTPDGGLALREEGTMRWPSFVGPASREYLLRPAGRADTLEVFFPDGRPFHRMGFAPDADAADHWCDPDSYRVAYTYENADRFRYAWDVTGPRKDLKLASRLHRSQGTDT